MSYPDSKSVGNLGGDLETLGISDLSEIGRGATSTVYSARQERYARDVAVKVFTTPLLDEKSRRRFDRECRTLGQLSKHPNVVNLLGSGFDVDGRPFIVMDLCDGGSLQQVVAKSGPLSVEAVLRTGVKIGSALAYAHSVGVLHRDIKPANILLTEFGEVALSDFGISDRTHGEMSWTIGESLTPLYAAPEVLENGGGSRASDLWSLAATLYALLLGEAPFSNTTGGLVALINRITQDPPRPLDRGDVPPALTALLAAGMQKDAARRPTGAGVFARQLQEVQRQVGLSVTEYTDVQAAPIAAPSTPVGPEAPGPPPVDQSRDEPWDAGVTQSPPPRPRPALDNDNPTKLADGGPEARTTFPKGAPPDVFGATTVAAAGPLSPPKPVRETASERAAAGSTTTTHRASTPEAEPPASVLPVSSRRRRWPYGLAVAAVALSGGGVALATSGHHAGHGKSRGVVATLDAAPSVSVRCIGLTCTLSDSTPLSAAEKLHVDFGDGHASDFAGTAIRHTYSSVGTYSLIATAVNGTGAAVTQRATTLVGLRSWGRTAQLSAASHTSRHLVFRIRATIARCRSAQFHLQQHSGSAWRDVGSVHRTNSGGVARLTVASSGRYRVRLGQVPVQDGICRATNATVTVHTPVGPSTSSTSSTSGSSSTTSSSSTSTSGSSSTSRVPVQPTFAPPPHLRA